MTDAGDLERLRRQAATGLRRAASTFEDSVGRPVAIDLQPAEIRAARPRAAAGTADALRTAFPSLDSELALQELANLLLPYIENALRNRRDIGAP